MVRFRVLRFSEIILLSSQNIIVSPYLYQPPAIKTTAYTTFCGADRCFQGRYRVPRSIYSVTIFTKTRIIYSVADIRVPARNPRIPHAHRGLLSQKYHCSAPLSSPAADAVYRSVRQHGGSLAHQIGEVMAPGLGGSPFRARWDATSVSLYSVVNEPGGLFFPSPCIPHFFRV